MYLHQQQQKICDICASYNRKKSIVEDYKICFCCNRKVCLAHISPVAEFDVCDCCTCK